MAVVVGTVVLGMYGLSTGEWHTTGSPEAKAAEKRETIKGGLLFGGILAVGAVLYLKTSHEDVGKGLMLGAGGVLATVAFDKMFPNLLLADKKV